MNFHDRSPVPSANDAPAGDPADQPIRSTILQEESLRSICRELGAAQSYELPFFAPFTLKARNSDNAAKIFNTYKVSNEAVAAGESVTPAAQWMLDNHYLVDEAIYQVKRDIPRRFYRQLPSIDVGGGNRVPRALALAWLYVAHTDSNVSEQLLTRAVNGFQSAQPLGIGELWAFPSLLRFVLLENLRRLAVRVERSMSMRRLANEVADKVLPQESEEDRRRALSAYAVNAREISFATQLLFRLRDGSQSAGDALTWLELELQKNGSDAEKVIVDEHTRQSSGNVTTGNIIRSLRKINDIEWTQWFEGVSHVDTALRARSNFQELDFASRDQYRTAIEDLARRSGLSESQVADAALNLAEQDKGSEQGDIGFFLNGPRREELEKAIGYRPYLTSRFKRFYARLDWIGIAAPVAFATLIILPLAAAGLWGFGEPAWAIALLVLLFSVPASEAALGFFNKIVLTVTRPTWLTGFEYKGGVPVEAATMVVIPTLIGSRIDVEDSVRNLEVHHLANMRGEIYFALLTDWPDSQEEQNAADLAVLDYAREQVAALNGRYPEGRFKRFHLFHRRRLYNDRQGAWMGWERKRGKLHELNLLLRGDKDTTFLPPDVPMPEGIVHIMTLDSDTRMTRDVVARLAGKLAHPLNTPRLDVARRKVTAGYAILQPRVTPSLTTGDEASFFQRIFSANRGMDPYVFAVSDVYQDVFDSGTFTGKGLYHIDAVEAALADRIPENSVLSHDLLEGAYARSGLATDVEVVEDYPTRYAVDASRQHRWARGDWQLLPFIFGPRSGLPAMSRWKMIDNLRRSVTPIFWVAASIAGWTVLDLPQATAWQLVLILSLFVAPTLDIAGALIPSRTDITVRSFLSGLGRDFAYATAHVVLRILLIAHGAWMMGDAIARTLYRLLVSRKDLLEWRTASQAFGSSKDDLGYYYTLMRGALVIAVVGLAIPVLAGSSGALVGSVFCALWVASPAFAWFISRSAETEDRLRVTDEEAAELRSIARRTWVYFESFVNEESNFLPPDNFQEDPVPVVAHRTSPTNIGMYVLSAISARDFGWISLANAVDRVDKTLATVERMQTYKGHLYNWYDTQTLQPLLPLYVSAVDSGNLAGHLVAAAVGLNEWAEAPIAFLEGNYDGLLDNVQILERALQDLSDERRQLRPMRQRLRERIEGMHRAVDAFKREPETAAIRTINLAVLAGEIRKLADGIHYETKSADSQTLLNWAVRLEDACEAHIADAHTDTAAAEALRTRMRGLAVKARTIAFKMDFAFLFRDERKLLSIGFRVNDQQLDESCYDLLASEARLTSLFGIAKGDLPTEHWFRLGRPIVPVGFSGALVSWSGSMFEYLMPPLVMKEPQGGILNQSNLMAIKEQMIYARSKSIPWGISEAAYNARDRELTYQYSNFGVPSLGLKRGLAQNTVVAPYATILAAQFRPREAIANLRRLAALGALGPYGFHDAIDFTPERLPDGATHAVVRNYMAHHSGMSVVAIANAVFEGRMRERFHRDPVIEAAELLLQGKAPRDIPSAIAKIEAAERKPEIHSESQDIRQIADPISKPRATHVMSNGRYALMLTATGSGYSRLGDAAITRWAADPTIDRLGTYLFVRDVETGDWWSATQEPKRAPGEIASTTFADEKATFLKTVGSLRTEVECIVIGEGDGEGRRITIANDADTDRHIEVTSYAEIALAPDAADSAHPAFSKMFVKTEILEGRSTIIATRQPRSKGEPETALAHVLTDNSGATRMTEAETDRRAFLGRGRSIANPAALDPKARLGGAQGFVLDPVMALRAQVRVPPRKKVSLTFWTVAAANRAGLTDVVARLDHPDSFPRQALMSWTQSQVQTRYIGISLVEAATIQSLTKYLLYPEATLRQPAGALAAGLSGQGALWPLSISGDNPIWVIRIIDPSDLEIVATGLRAQEYLRMRGLVADLVILNEQAASYAQDLQQAIDSLCENSRRRSHEFGPRQHLFAVRRDLMDERTYRALLSAARVVLHARNGTIYDQIERAGARDARDAVAEPAPVAAAVAGSEPTARRTGQRSETPGDGLAYWNGFGGFDRKGRDYVVRLSDDRFTPQPWINIVANAGFGFHVSAEGAGFTWSRNSRDFQLTPWSNDPVTNRPGEGIYIHDLGTRRSFSPVAALLRDEHIVYEARHSQGWSSFKAVSGGLETELVQLVDRADPVKISRLTIRNNGSQPARLRVYAYAEWLLGTSRGKSAPMIVPSRDAATGALMAQNPFSLDFGDRVAFLASDEAPQSWTADRNEFIAASGSVEAPSAVIRGAVLLRTVEAGRDPCAAIARDIEVAPGAEASLLFLMGDAASADDASRLVAAHRTRDFAERMAETDTDWRGFLDTVQVETPDPSFDALVNHWLPYQGLACRIRARSAFYQASGAFGFRDQLQDTLSLLLHDPELAHAQILNAASRQFREGDVQHWWLPRTGAGVRTTISDDVVWLGYCVQRYLEVTGNVALLDEETPFIEGRALEANEHDAYFTPEISQERASIYEHAARALDLAVKRTGPDGLPLILGGDWNDGMNSVGDEGKGESVWLAWFLSRVLADFTPLASGRGDTARAERWTAHLKVLKAALESKAWDGAWYRRGTYDDGSPLGSASSDECRIDSIAQSWSVLSGAGDTVRASQAMDEVLAQLADDKLQIVKLFTPPFDEKSAKDPGYIKGYPPGVRENGGQYTHAATWVVAALAELGRGDDAWRVFSMLNPVRHALDEAAAETYRVEPYVVSADIYSGDVLGGRGGWTWYTGSAGWLYRVAVENILGIRKKANRLWLKPVLPSAWDGYSATLKLSGTVVRIKVVRGAAAGLSVDGAALAADASIELKPDSEIDVTVTLAPAAEKAAAA